MSTSSLEMNERQPLLESKIVNFIYFHFSFYFPFIFLFSDLELEVSVMLYMTVTNCHMSYNTVIVTQSCVI